MIDAPMIFIQINACCRYTELMSQMSVCQLAWNTTQDIIRVDTVISQANSTNYERSSEEKKRKNRGRESLVPGNSDCLPSIAASWLPFSADSS